MTSTITDDLKSLWRDLPLRYKGAAMVAIPVFFMLTQVVWLERMRTEQQAAAQTSLDAQQVQLEAAHLLSALMDAETGERGYVITRREEFLQPYQHAIKDVPDVLSNLRQLVSDNPAQMARWERIRQIATHKLEICTAIKDRIRNGHPGDSGFILAALNEGKTTMDAFRSSITDFVQAEQLLLDIRSQRLQRNWQISRWVLGGGAVLGLLGGILATVLLSGSIAQRLEEMAEQASALALGLPLPSAAPGRDEFSLLEHKLHAAYELVSSRGRELIETEAQTREQNRALAESNAELEAFSYSVSHDLRSPLRHIDGYSKILLEDFAPSLDAEARRMLERIRHSTIQMGRLIDELLTLGRIGRQPLQRQITGLNSLVEEVRAELAADLGCRAVEWRIGDLPFADCDPVLLRQVFVNLMSNALKYSRTREGTVISIGQTATPNGPAIYVRDNGVGFSMKYADKLFGIFQRLHRSEDFEGTGVGLATAARVVRRHGGKIWAEAEIDRGATLYFTLAGLANVPIAAGEKNDDHVRERS